MKKDSDILEILRHSRHDWLNFVQLIKGNLALKKYDRVEEIIEDIIQQTQHENKLSNLHLSKFASDLLLFNWRNGHNFQIDFEVVGDARNLSQFEERLVTFFENFIFSLNESCVQYADNHLLLVIELIDETAPQITFDFQGSLIDVMKIKKVIENEDNRNEQLKKVECYISKEEFNFTFKLAEVVQKG
jgi:stage 0 sporulation protein B (sporulation initiation phosphotransferase)